MTADDSPPMLLHLGYPKASSTWLQERFFRFPEMGYWRAIRRARKASIGTANLETSSIGTPDE